MVGVFYLSVCHEPVFSKENMINSRTVLTGCYVAITICLSAPTAVIAGEDEPRTEDLPKCRDIGIGYRNIRGVCNTVGKDQTEIDKWLRKYGADMDSCGSDDAMCRDSQEQIAQDNCIIAEFKCSRI